MPCLASYRAPKTTQVEWARAIADAIYQLELSLRCKESRGMQYNCLDQARYLTLNQALHNTDPPTLEVNTVQVTCGNSRPF